MLINYLKIACRNLLRQKMFTFINIFGLALSMSVCLLVLLHIKDQVSYDLFHTHAGRIYRITTKATNKEGNTFKLATTPLPLASKLTTQYNLADEVVRIYPGGDQRSTAAGKRLPVNIAFTDSGFFQVFGFTLASGDPEIVLKSPNSIVLSRETARRFFGENVAPGQIISIGELGDFRITGIMDKPPGKSHIDFDAYVSMSSVPLLEKTGKLPNSLETWQNGTAGYTYVLLRESVRKDQLNKAVASISAELASHSKFTGKENFEFAVQPFHKIILGEEMLYSLGNVGSMGKIWAEIAIALIILISACFNYTNLSIARSLKRGKEVGIRKVNGASRLQVFAQFIVESVLLALLSLVLAFVLLKTVWTNAPFSAEFISYDATIDGRLLLWFFLFSFLTGLLAGALPAWALSSFRPVEVLKNLSNVKLFGGNRLGKALIVAQFTLSLVITIFTIIFYKQFDYMAGLDPGYARNHIISVPLNGNSYELVSHDIMQMNGVVSLSASSDNPGKNVSGSAIVRKEPGSAPFSFDYYYTDRNFIKNMDLKLVAGRTFPEGAEANTARYVVLNELAVSQLQLSSSAEAVGKSIYLDTVPVQVAGVIRNFYHRGVDIAYRPLVLRYQPQEWRFVQVRVSGNEEAAVHQLRAIWSKYNPGETFSYHVWKDGEFKGQGALGSISMLAFLALMAITIACMGLLGIVIYNTETRRKEIGIRKVMGATLGSVMLLLSKKFLKLVLIAGCIAIPLSYAAGYFFLNIFANRISPGIGIMLSGFTCVLMLAIATIGTQVYKVAGSNPVENLRTE